MQATQDRQKSYADQKRKPMAFEDGDRVMLKVSSWKGVVRFGKRGKLNPRYVRPFRVLAKVGKVTYRLELPQELSRVHHTFHVSNLKKSYAGEPLVIQIMAPTTRRGPNTPVNNTNPNNTNPNNMTPESIQAMIDQDLLRNSTNGDGSHSSHEDNRRNMQTARPCFYADFMKSQPLNFKGIKAGRFDLDGIKRWS
ncbi:hypothetical protein Tco_0294364 [Tanacetum coccineum]